MMAEVDANKLRAILPVGQIPLGDGVAFSSEVTKVVSERKG